MGLTLLLHKPIRVQGKEITEITLRDLVSQDVFETGLPMLLISTGDDSLKGLEFRPKILAALISRLAGIPIDAVKSMAMKDVGQCQMFIHKCLL